MKLYAESSAVLTWLLDEPKAAGIAKILAKASHVIASDLTVLECERALVRRLALEHATEVEIADCRARLQRSAAHWVLLPLTASVLERARNPFTVEPVRTLDAIHLATALVARGALGEVSLLTLDERVRQNGRALGFEVLP